MQKMLKQTKNCKRNDENYKEIVVDAVLGKNCMM